MDTEGEKGLTVNSQPPSRPQSRATISTIDTVNGNINSSNSSLDSSHLNSLVCSTHASPNGSSHHIHRRPTYDSSGKPPGLKWHNEYDEAGEVRPRVLMIEYHRRDLAQQVRRVTAREFKELDELRSVYHAERNDNTILRVFHVQNCSWGENYLMRKHAFDTHALGVHTSSGNTSTGPHDFGRWVKERQPQRRLGKLMMSSKTWKTHTDPWRGVARTAFGMDYMKAYTCEHDIELQRRTSLDGSWEEGVGDRDRVLGLQGFDDHDNTIHAHNIYSQRLSVYVQYKHRTPPEPDPDIHCPYGSHPEAFIKRYDNGNSIIIIDNSHTRSIYDTIIPARGHLEGKWRRLPFSIVSPPGSAADTEAHINLHCMKMIVRDVFKAVVNNWERVLEVSWEHVSILEDAIYEQPADESRAPELWTNSAHWNRYEKLMLFHVDTMNDMRRYLGEFVEGDFLADSGSGVGVGNVNGNGAIVPSPGDKGAWLEELPADFDRLGNLIQEDLVKPTANLSELMYRSVGIRDSRASLQLGSSMWRLSWITFIFLPATFIVGFFGMNVETFAGEGTPSIKWFFIALVPFFTIVILGWYLLKHALARNRRAPLQRGLYEALYTRLEEQNPDLWTRQGPKEYITPADWMSRLKWRLIRYWTEESRLPKAGEVDEPIGAWNRVKRYLMAKWTREIKIKRGAGGRVSEEGSELGEVLTVENPNAERLVPGGRVIVVKNDHEPEVGAAVGVEEVVSHNIDARGRAAAGIEVTISGEDENGESPERKGREGNGNGNRNGSPADGNSEILIEERREAPGMEEGMPEIRQLCDGGNRGHRLGVKGLSHTERDDRSDKE